MSVWTFGRTMFGLKGKIPKKIDYFGFLKLYGKKVILLTYFLQYCFFRF